MVVPYWTAWASPGPYSRQLLSGAGSDEHTQSRARKTLQVILLSLAPPPACHSMPGESLGYNLCNARKEYLLSLQCKPLYTTYWCLVGVTPGQPAAAKNIMLCALNITLSSISQPCQSSLQVRGKEPFPLLPSNPFLIARFGGAPHP
jgi:hypothetical protein